MNILITGAAGYIGSVTAALLKSHGHTVIALDNLREGHRDSLPKDIRFIKADVSEFKNVITPADQVDAVVHLGAYIAAGESMQKPEKYWQNNVVNTITLVGAMRDLKIPRLIFASTAAVYGNPESTPITEQARTNPTSTYGMTKLAMDMAITSECTAHKLAATSLRFFNVAGAYGRAGERHKNETHIIPLAFEALANDRQFTLFGDDYPTPDGTCIRDYIHVADLARAMLCALEKLKPGEHRIYNFGNGNGFSNKEVIATIEQVTGRKLRVAIGPRRPGDPARLVASSQKAQQELGWKPEKPELTTIIADAWEFYQAYMMPAKT